MVGFGKGKAGELWRQASSDKEGSGCGLQLNYQFLLVLAEALRYNGMPEPLLKSFCKLTKEVIIVMQSFNLLIFQFSTPPPPAEVHHTTASHLQAIPLKHQHASQGYG